MVEQTVLPGSAYLQLVGGVPLMHPEEQVWEAMRRGFAIQQQSRYLAPLTVDQRDGQLRRFAAWTNEYPWKWRPQDVEEWTSAAASERHLARTTVMGVHLTLRLFMEYLIDGRYGWAAECEKRFGTHPIQICHEWNTVRHVGDYEGRPTNRPLSRPELQTLFDAADDRAERIRRQGRKGWAAAFRDATILKVAYAWGLRRREVSRLELVDWGRNPQAPEFRDVGALQIRWAKAVPGGPPRRRTVLTVFDWAVDNVEEYLTEIRPLYDFEGLAAMWPTERGGRTADANIGKMFANLRDEAGLPAELGPHCLRHSYVTHLIEDARAALRPTTGGTRLGVDDGDLHQRRIGLQEPGPAFDPGPAPRPTEEEGGGGGVMTKLDGRRRWAGVALSGCPRRARGLLPRGGLQEAGRS